ncbi:MAG TPA: hypothetical protein PKL96_02220, partial [Bacteroidales bacterium]|nr:hypothetical protein [Bacteroidales bacterium]
MKTLVKILFLVAWATFFVSCRTTNQTSTVYDDVYGNKPAVVATPGVDQPARTVPPSNTGVTNNNEDNGNVASQNRNYADGNYNVDNYTSQDPNYSNSETYYDEDGNTYVTNNYYYDDYYDYSYSSRIRRFYDYNPGWGYYDNYYTNSYWYNYDPYFWGVSIYTGYNWWWPTYYYRPYWGYNYGWGHGCWGGGYGWSPYGYGWGHHYGWGNGYWSGYNNGYWDGYWNGYNDGYWGYSPDYYFNSYDYNSFYGHREQISGSTNSNSRENLTLGDKYVAAHMNDVASTGIINPAIIGKPSINSIDKPAAGITVSPTIKDQIGKITKPVKTNATIDNNMSVKPSNNINNNTLPTEKPANTYTKPENSTTVKPNPNTYTKPENSTTVKPNP